MSTGAILNQLEGGIPSGVIVMWSGETTNIPSGWFLCDGQNGTPDLRNRFIVGAGSSYGVGDTGGSNSVTLTKEQMPSHTHTITSLNGSVTIPATDYSGGASVNAVMRGGGVDTQVTGSISYGGGTISSTGGSSSHENRPPYYALAYIMKA